MTEHDTGIATLTHLRWPSFGNIHRLVDGSRGALPCSHVVALEKLNGSNLGLEIDPVAAQLVAIHGRNSLLWSLGGVNDEDPFDRKYGNVQTETLHALSGVVPRLVDFVQSLQNVRTTAVVYGEWYKKRVHDKASWHPFGICIRGATPEDNFRMMMTTRLHQQFCLHNLDPPRVLFSGGTIFEAINALYPLLLDRKDDCFEGAFITPETGGTRGCAKWKTAQYDEQPKFPLEDTNLMREQLQAVVVKLRKVYDEKRIRFNRTCKIGSSKAKSKEAEQELASLRQQVLLAFGSVLSKSATTTADIRALEKTQRATALKRLYAATKADLEEQYESVGEVVPIEILQLIGKVVSAGVMKS